MSCLQLKTDRNDRRAAEKVLLGPWQVQAMRNRRRRQQGIHDEQYVAATETKRCTALARLRTRHATQKTHGENTAPQKTPGDNAPRGENTAPQKTPGDNAPRDKTHSARKRFATQRALPVEAADVSPKPCLRHRATSICCPNLFAGESFQSKVAANREGASQRWIFELISGHFRPNENVFLDEAEWMLVQGHSHTAHQIRYLVVFKDLGLHTIRDLRQAHVQMLVDAWRKVKRFVATRHESDTSFQFYFHYMPSVFQLHMHVCMSSVLDMNRTQRLACVLRNLRTSDTWYRDALILFAAPRQPRANAENWADRGEYKQVRVCI